MMTMRSGPALWTVFLVLGALVWIASLDAWGHPAYRLAVITAVFVWAGYVVWTPKTK
jgi:hypothetical protein